MVRRPKLFVVGVPLAASAAAAVLVLGCVDLFHGFDDLKNACGQTTACEDAGADAGDAVDGARAFCEWSEDEARAFAVHACSWLGACESPMGQNQLGSCILQATLAYDCAANPSMPVNGELRAYWERLRTATSCADVYAVTKTTGAACKASSGTFSSCGSGDKLTGGGSTRVECVDSNARAPGERCLVSGQTCASYNDPILGTRSVCAGTEGRACTTTRCDGTSLHVCSDGGVDLGRECGYFGGGACATTDAGPACAPLPDAGSCTPTRKVTCEGAVAVGCTAGLRETVDCRAVLAGSQCTPTTLAPGAAVASACTGSETPVGDTCSGDVIVASAQGTTLRVKCGAQGLGPCRLVPVVSVSDVDGGQKNAACSPPDGG